MIYPMDSPVEHEREVVDTLKLYDKNNDGFITFEEYRGKGKCVVHGLCGPGQRGTGKCVVRGVSGPGLARNM